MKSHTSLFFKKTHGDEVENYITFLRWSSAALLLMICATVVGWYYMRLPVSICSPPRAHSTSLDYLLLISSAGSFLLSTKRLVKASLHNTAAIYTIQPLLNIVQLSSQIAFLYKVKDMDIQLGKAKPVRLHVREVVITAVLFVMCACNLVLWMATSWNLSEQYDDVDESIGWQTFDNIVGPLNAFFRFSSALLVLSTYGYFRSLKYPAVHTRSFLLRLTQLNPGQHHANINGSREDSRPSTSHNSAANNGHTSNTKHQQNTLSTQI